MTLKQVTLKEVREAAAKSKRAAIRCSLRRWNRNHNLTVAVLTVEKVDSLNCKRCALCQRYSGYDGSCSRNGRPCPLKRYAFDDEQCAHVWHLANTAFCDNDEERWKKYSGEMVELLKGLL